VRNTGLFMSWSHSLTTIAICGALLLSGTTIADAKRLAGERSLSKTKYGYAITEENVRGGRQSQRFELRSGDCWKDTKWSDCENNRSRTEIELKHQWKYGTDKWFGFSVLVAKDFPLSNRTWTTIAQIHQVNGFKAKEPDGSVSTPNHLQLALNGDTLILAVHTQVDDKYVVVEKAIAPASQVKGKWVDIQLRFDTSSNTGKIQVYMNGSLFSELPNSVIKKPNHYYFKYGIYTDGEKTWGKDRPTMIIHFDEMRIGNTRESVGFDAQNPID
jgi:hypothetical protein